MSNATITSKEDIYKGYLELAKYSIAIPCLKSKIHPLLDLQNLEVVKSLDSVCILIYAYEIDSIVLCQQFRLGVFINENNEDPFILECVAGTIEKGQTPEETAKREVKEETGLEVTELTLLNAVYKSPGLMTEKSYLYYTKVKGKPKSEVHGLKNEQIVTKIVKRKEVYNLMDSMKIKDATSLILLTWFRLNQKHII